MTINIQFLGGLLSWVPVFSHSTVRSVATEDVLCTVHILDASRLDVEVQTGNASQAMQNWCAVEGESFMSINSQSLGGLLS